MLNAKCCGARAFAFFTRSSRTWTCPPLDADHAAKFRDHLKEHGFLPQHVLPHGTYLSNCGAPPGTDVRTKSLEALKDELRRCAALGLVQYNWHPGSSTCCPGGRAECVKNVADAINECHAEVPGVTMVIETMAAQGGSIGSTLEEIRDIIAGVTDKSRVGVCIDTAHIHGAGYDCRSAAGWAGYMSQFDAVIGLSYLKGMHLNDGKVRLGSKKDRHWNIGKGFVGIEGFRAIMNDSRTAGIPLILETPPEPPSHPTGKGGKAKPDDGWRETYTREIALLYSLQGTQEGDPVPVHPAPWVATGKAPSAARGGKQKGGATGEEEATEEGDEGEGEEEEGGAAAASKKPVTKKGGKQAADAVATPDSSPAAKKPRAKGKGKPAPAAGAPSSIGAAGDDEQEDGGTATPQLVDADLVRKDEAQLVRALEEAGCATGAGTTAAGEPLSSAATGQGKAKGKRAAPGEAGAGGKAKKGRKAAALL